MAVPSSFFIHPDAPSDTDINQKQNQKKLSKPHHRFKVSRPSWEWGGDRWCVTVTVAGGGGRVGQVTWWLRCKHCRPRRVFNAVRMTIDVGRCRNSIVQRQAVSIEPSRRNHVAVL